MGNRNRHSDINISSLCAAESESLADTGPLQPLSIKSEGKLAPKDCGFNFLYPQTQYSNKGNKQKELEGEKI